MLVQEPQPVSRHARPGTQLVGLLLEGGICRCYELDITFLCKQFAACLVDIG